MQIDNKMQIDSKVRAILVTTFALVLAGCAADQFPNVSKQQFQVAPNVVLAGELLETSFVPLAEEGIVIIDLRTAEEGIAGEAQLFAQRGVPYFNLPVARGVSREQVAKFDTLLRENKDRQIVVHCASGNRAGMLWAAHLVEQGVGVEAAQESVAGIVTKAPVNSAIEKYAQEHNSR